MGKKELYTAWLKAKKTEEKAKDQRHDLEAQIEALMPQFEGLSKTFNEEGFKITLKKSESYKFLKEWDKARDSFPEELRPEKIKVEVDKKGLEYLKENDPETYKSISGYVEYKPGKTGISIEKEGK